MSDKLPIPSSPEKIGACSAQAQELKDIKTLLKTSHSKYTKYKILYDALQDSVSNSNLDENLKKKVNDILLGHRCAQVVDLDSNGLTLASNTLLGLPHLNTDELNYNESIKLKKELERILQNKYESICEQFFKITGENINVVSACDDFENFSLSTVDHALLELKKKLEEQQKKYLHNLLKEQELLECIVKLRLDKLPEVCNDKVKECQIKSQMSELQSRIVQQKTRVDIFMETSNSLPAYQELMKDIKEQQDECHTDIIHLQKLKEKYKQVSCRQYDDLLKSFIQYKSSLAKKKLIYEAL